MAVPCSIPFFDMKTRFDVKTLQALQMRANEVIVSGQYIGGDSVDAFEAWMAELHGVSSECAVGVANGTDALMLAFAALGIGAGDKVIIPAICFYATAGAVLRLGATPVAVDVLADRPLLDPAAVSAALDDKVKAVVPVHLFGEPCPPLRVGVPIVEDKAQMALTGRLIGHCATLSFYPTKILGALGDAGMVICRDIEIARHIRRLASHGGPDHECISGHSGWNSRLDSIQAAMLMAQRDGLSGRLDRRRDIAARYDQAFGSVALHRTGAACSVYTVCVRNRDRVREILQAAGIGTKIYYPKPLVDYSGVQQGGPIPNAIQYCKTTLSLPFHEGLSDADVVKVIDTLHFALRESQ